MFFGARDPNLTAEAFGSRLNAPKSNLYTLVSVPFGSNLSYPSNPYERSGRADVKLARFPEVLVNFFELNAYSWVPGTLS